MADDSTLSEMPFYNISTHELVEHLLFLTDGIKNDICQNTYFHSDIVSTSNNELLKQMEFSYCTDSEFNKLVDKIENKIELSVFHLNIRSLNKNHSGLCHFLQLLDLDFDVLVLSEIWNYNLEFYTSILKNYTFYYAVPDGTNIGGVGMFVKNTFSCNELLELNIPSHKASRTESLWLEISNSKCKYIVGGIYRHPNHDINDFCLLLEKSMEKLTKSKIPCIIAGDINIDFGKYKAHQETTAYVNNLLVNNFLPMIIMPTRITAKSATIVDHIYYREGYNCNKELHLVSGNLWSDLTDHLPNYFIIYNESLKTNTDRPLVRLHSAKNIATFRDLLHNVNWDPIFDSVDVNAGYHYFSNRLEECYNRSFKLVRLSRKRSKDKHWITSGLKRSSQRKNKLFRKWLLTRSPKDEEKYKNYRRYFKQIATEAEKSYYADLFDTRCNSVKQLWSNLSSVASFTKKKSKNSISKIIIDDLDITDTKAMSDAFNNYFCSVGQNLQKNVNSSGTNSFADYLPAPAKDSMFCIPTTCTEVLQIISKFKNKKSPGPDYIGPQLLKEVANSVAHPLVHLFNLSLTSGKVPNSLKIAKVIPVYKKGSKHTVGNYRPISLLSVFDKILEKIMHARLYNYLNSNNLLYSYQFGFRRNHSTGLALIDVVDQIYQSLDNHEKVIGIYLDLQKAFDTVDHTILLAKLYHYGIRGNVYEWFKDYLSDRKQYVCISGINSELGNISCGVPQGSVLGPLLFLVYVNDIGYSVPNTTCTVKLFADDTNLFISRESVDDLQVDAGKVILQLSNWFSVNKLSLSLDKTCYTIFGVTESDKCKFNLKIGDVVLQQVEYSKYLGVLIDAKLTWQQHIDYVFSKVIKFTSIFYRISHRLNIDILKMIYFAFVHPHLAYGIEIYGNTYQTHLSRLIILNNKLLRILQNAAYETPVANLYAKFNTLALPDLHTFQVLKIVHKFIYHHEKLPYVFSTYFTKNSMWHSYNTRNKESLHLEFSRTSLGQRSVKYKGSSLWNTLPEELKYISSTKSFNNKLKELLVNQK